MKCEFCNGKGEIQGQSPDLMTRCPVCNGVGETEQTKQDAFVLYLKGNTYHTNQNYEGYYTDIMRYKGTKLAVITPHSKNAVQYHSTETCLTAIRQLLTECSNINSIIVQRIERRN